MVQAEQMESRELLSAANFGFASNFEGGASEVANDVATDASGNVFTVGSFSGTTDFDPGAGSFPLTSGGAAFETDAFISKLDSDGNFVAAAQFTSLEDVEATGIDIDPSGNIYITGHMNDATDFDPSAGVTTVNGNSGDVFVAKLDNNLNLQWAQRIGGGGRIVAEGIAVDDAGRSYIAGWFNNTIDFQPGSGENKLTAGGRRDGYVLKFDAAGDAQWVSRFSGSGGTMNNVADIDVDGRGNPYIAGWFDGTADFNPRTGTNFLTSAGGRDAFVSRLDRAGGVTWVRQLGGNNRDESHAIAVDPLTKDVYFASSHIGTVDLDPGPAVVNHSTASGNTSTGHEHFLTRFDGAGTHVWTNQFTESSGDLAVSDVAVDPNLGVFATGVFSGTIDFDAATSVEDRSAGTGSDIFASRYTSAGDFVWSEVADPFAATGIAVASSGAVHVSGHGAGGDFDPGSGTFNLGPGAFVWQLTQTVDYTVPSTVSNIIIRRTGNQFEVYDSDAATVLISGPIATTAGLVIDGSNLSALDVVVDYGFGGQFDFVNGIELVSSSGSGDELTVLGGASLNVEYEPVTSSPGTSQILIDAASDISFSGFEQTNISQVNRASVRASASRDTLVAVGNPDLGGGGVSLNVSGDADGSPIVPLRLYDVLDMTFELRGGNDAIEFDEQSLNTRGLQNLEIVGGRGNDRVDIYSADLTLDVAGGDIHFDGGTDSDTLAVTGDTDFEMNINRVKTTAGGQVSYTDLENSRLTGGASANLINARRFDGTLFLSGEAGDDTLIGGVGDDTINGGAGNDDIRGREGNDALRGGADEDTIRGNDGNDLIGGGNHPDMIFGEAGSDTLLGGNGDDHIDGGANNDALIGEAGADSFQINADNLANLFDVTLITNNFVQVQQNIGANFVERDTVEQDSDDELFVDLFGGNDTINVAANVTLDGTVDGGLGNDTCSAPGNWDTTNC